MPRFFADIDVSPQDAVGRMKFVPVALEGSWRLPGSVAPCFNARMTSDQPWWLTMPPAEVAATILPLFSSSAWFSEVETMENIVSWWKTGSYLKDEGYFVIVGTKQYEDPDIRAVAEAIQVLEHAGLLMRTQGGHGGSKAVAGLTRLGMHALQTNTVRQHLGLGDTTPPA